MPNQSLPDFDQLWDYDQPDETEAKFRALLPAAVQSGNRSYYLELLTQIARAQGLQRKFDEAHRTLDEVEAQLADDLQRARIRYLLERGRVFNSSHNPDAARPLFLLAWELAQAAHEDGYAVDAAHMAAIVATGDEQQLALNLKALEMAENSVDPGAQRWRGSLYNNLGWTYHDRGEYEKALEIFKRALAFRRQHGNAQTIQIARWAVARTLRSLGRVEEALTLQRELLADAERAGRKAPFAYEEMAECLLLLGRQEEARPYFALAYEELSKEPWRDGIEPERLARLNLLAC